MNTIPTPGEVAWLGFMLAVLVVRVGSRLGRVRARVSQSGTARAWVRVGGGTAHAGGPEHMPQRVVHFAEAKEDLNPTTSS